MNVRELRLMTGLSQQKFADYFKIPFRTLQNWEYGEREAPEYVIELIKYKLEMEGLIMTREQIEALNGEIVTAEQFEEIEQSAEVARVENNGNSGRIPGATWYTIYFTDDEEMDIYYKGKEELS